MQRLTSNKIFTFNSFFVGSSNRFAFSEALSIASNHSQHPLYILGGPLTGKTHLLEAIHSHVLQHYPKTRVTFTRPPELMSELITSLMQKKTELFKIKYRRSDLLLIDDIESIGKTDATQDELYFAMRSLLDSGKRIIVSARCLPNEIFSLKEELLGLLQGFLIVDIQEPEKNVINSILERALAVEKIHLSRMHLDQITIEIMNLNGNISVPDAVNIIKKFTLDRRLFKIEDVLFALSSHKRVLLANRSFEILDFIRKDYSAVFSLSPDDFELLICDRLSKMGLQVERVGSVYARDGGIDIVAWPTKSKLPFLLAAQVKHHRQPWTKSGPNDVKEFQGALAGQPFSAGILVTNTTFTPDARWFAANKHNMVRLRQMEDLQRWIWNNFTDETEWREIPTYLELAPGLRIELPWSKK